jgi:inward rectifier potassium channel
MNGTAKRPSVRSDTGTRMPRIVAVGRRLAPHEDFYHFILTLGWLQFFLVVAVGFVLANTAFALLYMIEPGCISNAAGFEELFFFSVQTLGTIGYGTMAPLTRFGHVVVSVEALVGLLFTAVVTGMTFARFARPTARILFSEKAIIAKRDGVPHLMFRLANWRRNQIVEAQLRLMVLLTERTQEGEVMRRPTPLSLVRDTNPMFALTWTALHRIDETSPFCGPDAMDRLRAANAEVYLSVSGLDETISQVINARYRYALEDIVYDARFVDVLQTREDGTRVIDYDKFHAIEPIAPPNQQGNP